MMLRGTVFYPLFDPDTDYAVQCYTSTGAGGSGGWVEMVASAPADIDIMILAVRNAPAGGSAGYYSTLDISIGLSGDEDNHIIVPKLGITHAAGAIGGGWDYSPLHIPVNIPRGARLSIRAITNSAYNLGVGIQGAIGYIGIPAPTRYEAIGYTSAGKGTSVICGNGSKGSWYVLSTSLPHDINGFFISNRLNAGYNGSWLVDIAIGSSGNEEIIVANYTQAGWTYSDGACPQTNSDFYHMKIPKGSRVSVRGQDSAGNTIIFHLIGAL